MYISYTCITNLNFELNLKNSENKKIFKENHKRNKKN